MPIIVKGAKLTDEFMASIKEVAGNVRSSFLESSSPMSARLRRVLRYLAGTISSSPPFRRSILTLS